MALATTDAASTSVIKVAHDHYSCHSAADFFRWTTTIEGLAHYATRLTCRSVVGTSLWRGRVIRVSLSRLLHLTRPRQAKLHTGITKQVATIQKHLKRVSMGVQRFDKRNCTRMQ